MTTYLTISAAYGRAYASARALKADWNAGKDFMIRSPHKNTYINKADTRGETLVARFNHDRGVCVIKTH